MSQGLRRLLYEVGSLDPVAFLVAPLILGVVTLIAAWVPARRAVRIDPLVAIRED